MKKLSSILYVVALFVIAMNTSASRKSVYGEVLVTSDDSNKAHSWKRLSEKQPKYPFSFVYEKVTGCAVLAFEIDASGDLEDIQIMQASPSKKLGFEAKKAIKKWRWSAIDFSAEKVRESRTIRIDYCLGYDSAAKTKLLCQQQSEEPCI